MKNHVRTYAIPPKVTQLPPSLEYPNGLMLIEDESPVPSSVEKVAEPNYKAMWEEINEWVSVFGSLTTKRKVKEIECHHGVKVEEEA